MRIRWFVIATGLVAMAFTFAGCGDGTGKSETAARTGDGVEKSRSTTTPASTPTSTSPKNTSTTVAATTTTTIPPGETLPSQWPTELTFPERCRIVDAEAFDLSDQGFSVTGVAAGCISDVGVRDLQRDFLAMASNAGFETSQDTVWDDPPAAIVRASKGSVSLDVTIVAGDQMSITDLRGYWDEPNPNGSNVSVEVAFEA
ncbi:MAG: hypothetical protein KF906_05140 [Actinobacteria bacterium]|nr:hypothetical protein [Actinomycetota bacterium]